MQEELSEQLLFLMQKGGTAIALTAILHKYFAVALLIIISRRFLWR